MATTHISCSEAVMGLDDLIYQSDQRRQGCDREGTPRSLSYTLLLLRVDGFYPSPSKWRDNADQELLLMGTLKGCL